MPPTGKSPKSSKNSTRSSANRSGKSGGTRRPKRRKTPKKTERTSTAATTASATTPTGTSTGTRRAATRAQAAAEAEPSSRARAQVEPAASSRAGRATARPAKRSGSTSPRGSAKAAGLDRDERARRELEASDKLYYRIGEVSTLTGVKAHVLRYWETEFRWMAPPKSRSKQRLYRKRDIQFVWLLKRLLWDERYTIAGARQRIQDLGVDGALALLEQGQGDAAHTGTPAAADAAPATAVQNQTTSSTASAFSESERNDTAGVSADWVSFQAALGEMHSELSAIRETLQEGL